MVAFVLGWHAPGLVLRWALLIVGLPMIVCVRATALHWLGLAFLAYAGLSLLWTPFPLDGCYELGIVALLGGSFCLGSCLERVHVVFVGAALGLVPSLIVGVMQWYGANPVLQLTPNPSGLFVNANIWGETASLALIGIASSSSACFRTASDIRSTATVVIPTLASQCIVLIAMVISAVSLLLSHHRTSMIALGIVGMIWLMNWLATSGHLHWSRLTRSVIVAAVFVAILSSVIFAFLIQLPILGSVTERIAIWHATLDGLTFLGHGAGSFRGLIPLYFFSKSEGALDYAHNDLLQLAFEYGIAALVPAAIFALLALRSASTMRYVLIVFGIQSLAEFPLYMPATGFLAALAAGHCSRCWPRCGWRDVLGRAALFGRVPGTQPRQA
jgi:O-Antigen ligase